MPEPDMAEIEAGFQQAIDRWQEILNKHPQGYEARMAIQKLSRELEEERRSRWLKRSE